MKRLDVSSAPELIRSARDAAGISQTELAERAGLRQAHLAAMASGGRYVSAKMLGRALRAARYRPSIPLEQHADEIVRLGVRDGIRNVRILGLDNQHLVPL